ncbi:MAG TPA: hypothetical protein VF209_01955 [Patescibacteria group bacterium]
MTTQKIIHWLDENILLVLCGFLIAFIPLYPKIPLFSPIESYIVRVRMEDIFVFIAAVVWFVQYLRRKILIKDKLVVGFIAAYAFAGLLSIISAVLITKTVPLEAIHLGKTLLHYFRYLEYFVLFFLTMSAIKSRQDFKVLLTVIVITVLGVSLYGFGQKYYYWPVYSTMNREFSKGIRLYLTEHARVQSTFGGHYDLAAYLVIVLPLLLSASYFTLKRRVAILLYLVFIFGSWLLIMSASRTSFLAYLVGTALVTTIGAFIQKDWWSKFKWGLSRMSLLGIVVFILMANFGSDMYERFLQVLEGYPAANQMYHQANAQRKEYVQSSIVYLQDRGLFIPGLLPKAQKPTHGVEIDNNEGIAIVPSDQRPVTEKPDEKNRPSDVYVDVPEIVPVASTSASGSAIVVLTERERVFSECALNRGLSLCIRLETLWPKAIEGFKRNPLFGSGYATLNKDTTYHFTEAESTDNNFLRTLGETGLFGFITFYGLVLVLCAYAYKLIKDRSGWGVILGIGFISATIGLLINAAYIDVFAASKVAFTYWALAGILVSYYWLHHQPAKAKIASKPKKVRLK